MSELAWTLLLFGAVCLQALALVSYVLIKGDWWRR